MGALRVRAAWVANWGVADMSRSWMLLLVLLPLSLGCQPTPVTAVKKNSAATAKPMADPEQTTPQDPVTKPGTSDPLPPPQTYTRPDEAEVSALAETPLEELMALLADAKQRDAASRAAIQRGKAAVLPLVAALQNKDPQVRAAAAFTLGQMGEDARPAVKALQAQADNDVNEIARDAAIFALEAIQEPES